MRAPGSSARTRATAVVTGLAAVALSGLGLTACGSMGYGSPEDVSLVVVVAVDQLRADMVQRFDPAFTGGFRRLLDEGFFFTEAVHDHGVTHTGAGHATLSTGVYPARSGVVGNDWLEFRDGQWASMYSVEDGDRPLVGVDGGAGRSPRNLERPGLADWIISAHEGARVASVSRKDRSAITLAGQNAGEVYWLSSGAGRIVTSEYYRGSLPGWVEQFNDSVMPELLADPTWTSIVPDEFSSLARDDASSAEGVGEWTTFPYDYYEQRPDGTERQRNTWLLETTPRADQATFEFARRALDELQLGQRDTQDYLSVSFSATDGVGHRFGPFSQEQLDNLLRLDALLGELMDLLDDRVGEGRWVLGLSSDHGVLEMPEHVTDGPPARRITRGERVAMREALMLAGDRAEDSIAYAERLASELEAIDAVDRAIPLHQLPEAAASDSLARLYSNSFRWDRRVGTYAIRGVMVRLKDRIMDQTSTRGTTHGTPYLYDRSVPIIFYGAGVPAGTSGLRARTIDFAPTLALLAGVDFPGDLDGVPLAPFVPDGLP